jgi:5-hydroxyisourate hydrolase
MISTHILDTSRGTPASGIPVKLRLREGDTWKEIKSGVTNNDGRHAFECEAKPGVYQIIFEVEDYLKNSAKETFWLNIPVVFKVENTARKYHIPLLLNPFGYSTYRGS